MFKEIWPTKRGLLKIPGIKNLRNAGLLLAFDLENKNLRDKLVNSLFEKIYCKSN